MACIFKHFIKCALDSFPDGVAMWLDNHAATNIGIFCQPCSVDDIEVPL